MPSTSVPARPAHHTHSTPLPARTALLSRYTHLRDPASVLVTGWKPAGADTFLVQVRWPAAHGERPYDPRLLTQTVRQSGLVVAHAEYGVPLDYQTLLRSLDLTLAPDFPVPRGQPADLDVEVRVPDTGPRRRTGALAMDIHLRHRGTTVAAAGTEFGWVSPAVYRRLRGPHPTVPWGQWPLPEPLPPALVGRATPGDVALSATGHPGRWLLRNDTANTLLFDHPVDHVPGLALIEAADQAAHALLTPTPLHPTSISTRYTRYVEFDAPCWVDATLLPAPGPGQFAAQVTGTQNGLHAFTTEFRGPTTPPPAQTTTRR
ncbi:ScbA/BarX family gamma-butyrolactone biosynthesis protein [Streptomyces cyaneofuscatus]|uniref:ScbA/BarX family gamma-butyrolactone biosynthesis protein n=1 Tax=Streptomyces cyaneofuscatus TaxID=66883 RepID=UPI0036DB4268